jgi:hypothetical protein
VALRVIVEKILPALTAPTYAPVVLGPVEETALAALTAQVTPNMPYSLATLTAPIIGEMQEVNTQGSQPISQFEQDQQTIPGLE